MPSAQADPVTPDFDRFLSKVAKRRVQSQLRALIPYYKPGVISFGGGIPHPSTWPINSMTISVPFANKSIFIPGYECSKPEQALPLAEYSAPHVPPSNMFGIAVPGHLTPDLGDLLQYGMSLGSPSLLSWLTEHAKRIHAPPYEDWQVITTAGNTDGAEALLNVLASDGDNVLVEEFAYPGLLTTLLAHGLVAAGVPLDGDGVTPDGLDLVMSEWDVTTRGDKPKMLILVPTCSNPTGITMSAKRKLGVYNIARKHDLLIIEDDPYCFLQVRPNGAESPIVPTFLSMDIDGRVVRIDSFSKIMSPGLRCGWITAHKEIVRRVQQRMEGTTQCPSGMSVAAISGVLQAFGDHEGFEQTYLPHISKTYVDRCLTMLNAFERYLPKAAVEWDTDPKGGMFIFLRLRVEGHPRYESLSPEEISQQTFDTMIDEKIITAPSQYFKAPNSLELSKEEEAKRIFLRLSFSYGAADEIEEGVRRMGRALTKQWAL